VTTVAAACPSLQPYIYHPAGVLTALPTGHKHPDGRGVEVPWTVVVVGVFVSTDPQLFAAAATVNN